ncbi:hypothetical protein ES692_01825 [Psychroserpens burtonensis]|uniref:Lysoplasmalogenase n=1 Tax=Psychroserpens burtonensis TaxID=49278 RepID=A0A5C7BCL4_9FLAO|nr:lysoplasmalogenase family protein [Psychroserpens burtonensis]TXE20023.1 hypothetical protein ES692_01825 [Psychroserpens burtonensis]
MKRFFNSTLKFSLVYFSLLLLDLFLIVWGRNELWRLVTMPVMALLLIVFYIYNDKSARPWKFTFMVIALSWFLFANIAVLFRNEAIMLILVSVFFILGNIFYILRFANNRDFDFIRLLPILALYLIYMFVILQLTLDNLGDLLIPIFIFLFVTLLTIQFALLRKSAVTKNSYYVVIIGMVFLLMSHTSAVLSVFYKTFDNQDVLTMLLYSIAQYLIVIGVVNEKKAL